MNGMTVVCRAKGNKQIKKTTGRLIFGSLRPVTNRNGKGRFFAPIRNMIGDAADAAANNPPTILRVVADYS